jgi:hypothetical protein
MNGREIAKLREKYLLVVMRSNAGKNKSKELSDYFTSTLVENYYSTAYEPWQDVLVESAVKSVMMLAKWGMAGSGLAGLYWFCAATNGKDCRNVTYKERIKNTPWGLLHNEKRNISTFRSFCCRCWMHLNKDWSEKGETAPRAVEAISLGFATDLNTSAYKIFIPSTGQVLRRISLCLMRVLNQTVRSNLCESVIKGMMKLTSCSKLQRLSIALRMTHPYR